MGGVFAENDMPDANWIELSEVGYFKRVLEAISFDNEINCMK